MPRNDFLEAEEEQLRLARVREKFQPSEEAGFVGLAGAARRTVAVAGAALAMAPVCESEIEVTLGARLKLLIDQWNENQTPKLELVPQYPMLRFRYDFGIVEAAMANDAAKNVAVWAIGAEIFRFTGSEIFRRDVDCAAGVEEFLSLKYATPTKGELL